MKRAIIAAIGLLALATTATANPQAENACQNMARQYESVNYRECVAYMNQVFDDLEQQQRAGNVGATLRAGVCFNMLPLYKDVYTCYFQ